MLRATMAGVADFDPPSRTPSLRSEAGRGTAYEQSQNAPSRQASSDGVLSILGGDTMGLQASAISRRNTVQIPDLPPATSALKWMLQMAAIEHADVYCTEGSPRGYVPPINSFLDSSMTEHMLLKSQIQEENDEEEQDDGASSEHVLGELEEVSDSEDDVVLPMPQWLQEPQGGFDEQSQSGFSSVSEPSFAGGRLSQYTSRLSSRRSSHHSSGSGTSQPSHVNLLGEAAVRVRQAALP
eukprot:TRINITY_DN40488_c0_g1_i1.p1 TRINITY_DN40488_c0_g1~~TRINITY_DN40488_c0_g1_i1.p1  ORF type:complete len:239 (-),score=45.57 TRINITY_DN40488_c0_g1_i1:114-830(-)